MYLFNNDRELEYVSLWSTDSRRQVRVIGLDRRFSEGIENSLHSLRLSRPIHILHIFKFDKEIQTF